MTCPETRETADPGTALGPRGCWQGRARGAGDERGLPLGLGVYGLQWRGEAQAARWGTRSAREIGARPTPVSPSSLIIICSVFKCIFHRKSI